MFCFDFVTFSRLLDFIELKIGFRLKSDFREKEFRFVNRELLSCLCIRLSDGGTAATEHSHCGRDEGSTNAKR